MALACGVVVVAAWGAGGLRAAVPLMALTHVCARGELRGVYISRALCVCVAVCVCVCVCASFCLCAHTRVCARACACDCKRARARESVHVRVRERDGAPRER